jgi:transposase-like protein
MAITPMNPFKGRHYSGEVILLAVRWYLRYPLAYEHVVEMLTERGLEVDASLHLALGAGVCSGN